MDLQPLGAGREGPQLRVRNGETANCAFKHWGFTQNIENTMQYIFTLSFLVLKNNLCFSTTSKTCLSISEHTVLLSFKLH